jgi:amino acid adenylation domain-containing protein
MVNTTGNRKAIEDIYPLSPMQQGMLFHSLYAPNSGTYIIQVSYELHGNLDINAFERAWQHLVDRHTVLRTAFVWDNLAKPLQVVGKVKCPITYLDWRHYSSTAQQQELTILLEKQRKQGFNLSKAPLMHITLIQLAPSIYQFVWSYHHLLLDGWSMPILLQEFLTIYSAYSKAEIPNLPNARPYRNYIAWLEKQDIQQAEAFWTRQLQRFTTPTHLTIQQNERPDNLLSNYIEQGIDLTVEETQQLNNFAKQQQITLSTLVHAAFGLLLSRYSGELEVLFGTVSAGRPATLVGVETMVGMFVNTLPLRISTAPEQKLYEWLDKVQLQQVEIRQYDYSSLADIHRWSEIPRSTPLFETLVVFENYPVEAKIVREIEIRNIQATEQTNYPLTLYAVGNSQLSLKLLYDSDRFSDESITLMLQQLQTLLLNMLQGNCCLGELTLFAEAQTLFAGKGIEIDIREKALHELIAEQVEKNSSATAIVFEEQRISYGELNESANQIAYHLQKLGIEKEARIGVYLERSPKLIIALLAILKAGGAYVPLDPTYPMERLRYTIEDAQMSFVITQTSLVENILDIPTINIDLTPQPPSLLGKGEKINSPLLGGEGLGERLAYLIYTSGSTGKPKGVMVEMGALVNILVALKEQLAITSTDRLLAVTTIAFDIAALELFLPLIAGAEVILTKQTALVDPTKLTEIIRQHDITVMQATPASWRLLFASGWEGGTDLKVLCGGEALDNGLAQQLLSSSKEVWNLYGPTETTIWSAAKKLVENDVTIGHPIANTQFYVLDRNLQQVPMGVAGELYIGGVGIARGYWQRPDLTAEKFIPTPNSSLLTPNFIYKTGDRVRYLPNGDLEYLGRLDNQVKIRGYRIELGEIESVLQTHPLVAQAVVTVRQDIPGEQSLVAYIVLLENKAVELREFLEKHLPIYMIPSVYVVLDKLPLTPNGKVNRQALPKNIPRAYKPNSIMPQTELEKTIAEIWRQLLNIDSVGIDDNFFDLGGHSLLVVRMQGQLRQHLHQEVTLVDLFRYPTINSLTKYLTQTNTSTLVEGEVESRINQLEAGKQRLLQRRQKRTIN